MVIPVDQQARPSRETSRSIVTFQRDSNRKCHLVHQQRTNNHRVQQHQHSFGKNSLALRRCSTDSCAGHILRETSIAKEIGRERVCRIPFNTVQVTDTVMSANSVKKIIEYSNTNSTSSFRHLCNCFPFVRRWIVHFYTGYSIAGTPTTD